MKKVFIFKQESNNDGEYTTYVKPCKTFEAAKRVMEREKHFLLTECPVYQDKDGVEEEESEDRYFIRSEFQNVYDELTIEESEVVE